MHTQGGHKMKQKHYKSVPFAVDPWFGGIYMQFWLFEEALILHDSESCILVLNQEAAMKKAFI